MKLGVSGLMDDTHFSELVESVKEGEEILRGNVDVGNQIMSDLYDDEDFSPYCPVCRSCGDSGCCPDWICKHTRGCEYPNTPNTLGVKIARRIRFFRPVYNFLSDLPFTLKRIFICSIFGHKRGKYFTNTCERCFELLRD